VLYCDKSSSPCIMGDGYGCGCIAGGYASAGDDGLAFLVTLVAGCPKQGLK